MDISIIGGADGPTSIFLTANTNYFTFTLIVLVVLLIVGIILIAIKRKNNKQEDS